MVHSTSPALTRWLLLAVAGLALSHAGCLRKHLLDDGKQAPPPPQKPGAPASRVFTRWNKEVQFGTDTMTKNPLAAITGRLYLFDEVGYPISGDGTLMVELYDDSGRLQGEKSKLLERWNIDADTLKEVQQKDQLGQGYTLSLPWSTYRPEITQIHMAVRYQPKSGPPLNNDGYAMTIDHKQSPQVVNAMPHHSPTVIPASATE